MPQGDHSSNDAVIVVPCDSWDDFTHHVRRDYAEEVTGISPIFRGHARKEWKLASPWERKLERWITEDKEEGRGRESKSYLLEKILRDFKDLAIGLPGVKSRDLDDIDWWTLGRHHGLVTPLLDWTKSPYVAAFFAMTGAAEIINPGITRLGDVDPERYLSADLSEPVAIWAFMVSRSIEEATELEILSSRIDIGHRQRAQRGLFTRLHHDKHLALESYLASLKLENPPLRQYLIPAGEAARAITELRMMNITFATLFPDLEGAALQANFEMTAFTLMAFSFIPADTWKLTSNQLERKEHSHNTKMRRTRMPP